MYIRTYMSTSQLKSGHKTHRNSLEFAIFFRPFCFGNFVFAILANHVRSCGKEISNVFGYLLLYLLYFTHFARSSRAEPLASFLPIPLSGPALTASGNFTSDSTDAFRIVPFKTGAVMSDRTLEFGQSGESGEDSALRMVLEKYLRKEQALLLKLMDIIAHSGALDVGVPAQILKSTP